MAKVIMVQGTTSYAGKSFTVSSLCRMLTQDGFKVAPFKSQNLSSKIYTTKDGSPMSWSQAMQAEACKIEPNPIMNPIFLNPTSDTGAQIVLNGKPYKHMDAMEYFKHKKEMIPYILESYNKLASEYDIIVVEGAGSPAEINLRENDIVNMGIANLLDAPVLIVADIDRGGAFASMAGTMLLLNDEEKSRVKGFIVNKFRGDVNLLTDGLKMIEDITKVPVVGVVPLAKVDTSLDTDKQFDILAYVMRKSINVEKLYEIIGINN